MRKFSSLGLKNMLNAIGVNVKLITWDMKIEEFQNDIYGLIIGGGRDISPKFFN